jgi:hypothetical protein
MTGPFLDLHNPEFRAFVKEFHYKHAEGFLTEKLEYELDQDTNESLKQWRDEVAEAFGLPPEEAECLVVNWILREWLKEMKRL